MRTLILLAIGAVATLPAAARAQAGACALPATIPAPHADLPSAEQPRRTMPTTGYTLALGWSPNYCHGKQASARDAFQCGGDGGKFGFTLHGLWPDGAAGTWPQYCRTAAIVPERVIRDTLCATPSAQLIQHEWAKHGTCMAPSPQAYFAGSTKLYRALRFPDMAALARRERVTAGDVANALAAANRGIPADAVRVTITKSGWLDELWLCLDTRLRYATCRPDSGGASRSRTVRITDPA